MQSAGLIVRCVADLLPTCSRPAQRAGQVRNNTCGTMCACVSARGPTLRQRTRDGVRWSGEAEVKATVPEFVGEASPRLTPRLTARPTQNAAERVIGNTATVWAALWIVGISFAVVSQVDSLRSVWIAVTGLAVLTGGWLLWIRAVVGSRGFVAVATVTAIAQVLNTTPAALVDTYVAAVPWLDLSALMAGFLLAGGRGSRSVGLIAVLGGFAISGNALVSGDLGIVWRECLMMPAHTLANGLAVAAGAWAVRRVAYEEDLALVRRSANRAAEAAARAHRDESFRISRTLHDTVINTLGAVGTGVSDRVAEQIRPRCKADLAALTLAARFGSASLADTAVDVDQREIDDVGRRLSQRAAARATLLGLRFDVNDPTPGTAPTGVFEAVAGAVDEALTNVVKHAGVASATLVVEVTPNGLSVTVRDEGRGFEFGAAKARGLEASILERARRAGVRARLDTQPGRGTAVVLEWRRDDSGALQESVAAETGEGVLSGTLVTAAKWAAACLLGTGLLCELLSIESATWLPTSAGLALATAAAVLVIHSVHSSGRLSWPVGAFAVLSAGIAELLPGFGFEGCARVGTVWWGFEAGLLVVILLALLGPATSWVMLGLAAHLAAGFWVAGQAGVTPGPCASQAVAVIVVDVGVIVGVRLFRRLIMRFGIAAETAGEEALASASRAAELVEQERARDVRARSALTSARPVLEALAAGTLDPNDSLVRARCGDEEAFLRSMLQVSPDLGALGDMLVRSVEAAHRAGRRLTVRSAEPVPVPRERTLVSVGWIVDSVVESLRLGCEAELTLFGADDSAAVMTIVVAGETPILAPNALAEARGAGLAITQSTTGGQTLIEVSWTGLTDSRWPGVADVGSRDG